MSRKPPAVGEWRRLPNGIRARVIPWPLVSGYCEGYGLRRPDGPRHVSGLINQKMEGHRRKSVPGED